MNRQLAGLLAATAGALALAASAAAAPNVQVTIRHELRGCHAWAIGTGPARASQSITVSRGTAITVVDDDVMPHTLVQLAGPRLALRRPMMKKIGAATRITLAKPGVYRFTTKAGEDYTKGVKTIGEDNVLKLTVVVH